VETEKASMDVEAPFAGTLSAQHIAVGDRVSPGAVIGYVRAPDEVGGVRSAAEEPGDLHQSQRSTTPARAPRVPHGELRGLPLAASGAETSVRAVTVSGAVLAPGPFADRSLSRRRRAIARRLTEAAAIPQFAVTRQISLTAAQVTVEALRAQRQPATLTDVLVSAVARVAAELPTVNAWFLGDTVRVFDHVYLALAVDTDEGVVAPVLREAESLELAAIAELRADLVGRARSQRLRADELLNATLTLTNVGPLGGDQLFPVVTPPQVAVIGVGRNTGDRAAFTFVGDHRVLDGADGARFLARLDEVLQPAGAR
jgi:pyruvate dehydrogenase E2 component (dihydrolipoamide acetyltransferase)